MWPPELHACPLLPKPFSLDLLARTLNRILTPDTRQTNGSA
jgi:hypothetical protein